MLKWLSFLYGKDTAKAYMPKLKRILKIYYAHKTPETIKNDKNVDPEERFTEKDLILITYGDLVHGKERSPLKTLAKTCYTHLKYINTLHILPFFPYSSDRGFSIIDFETVDPHLGTWDDIHDLEHHYQLMFDGVINHASSKSRWFQEFLDGSPAYKDFFTSFGSPEELTPEQRNKLFRPRTSDILTEFKTINGPIYVWTTFSKDQIDLNFKNPKVLMKVIEILLLYVRHGADIIRLDAITYLWDEPGTRGANLRQTHEIVKLFRDILDVVAPSVSIVTETNVPHKENISYLGNGHDEAQMVYNFALSPLVLYTFYKGDSTALSKWLRGLKKVSNSTTFFNILDTHDGVGLLGAKNILKKADIDFIIQRAEEHGGYISHKAGKAGIKEPYEINITWYSALNLEESGEDMAFQVKRVIASRSIALAIKGVPGIYLHGLIGTKNDIEAVLKTKSKRAINRTVIDSELLNDAINDPKSKLFHIVSSLHKIFKVRTKKRAFHPNGDQKVLMISPSVFTVLRVSPEGDQHILTLTNVTDRTGKIEIPLKGLGTNEEDWYDLISGEELKSQNQRLSVKLEPYDVIWLEPLSEIK
ncbi:MAG: alpha-amylase family glycosyl hydrolase [Candidatus Hydrothermarchaeales archaeon]